MLKSNVLFGSTLFRQILRGILPSDKTFWNIYSPVIKILKDSFEHRKIRSMIDLIFEFNDQDVVLEEGCGKAIWLNEIEPYVKHTVGLDIDKGMLEGARKQSPRSFFVQANLNNNHMPFRDCSFTKIGSILVEGYLRNVDLAIREKYRILKPGGMIAVVSPKKGAKFFKVLVAEAKQRKEEQTFIKNLRRLPLGIIAVLFGKIAEMKAVIGDWNFYDRQEMIDNYHNAGFEIVAHGSVYANQAWLLIARKPLEKKA